MALLLSILLLFIGPPRTTSGHFDPETNSCTIPLSRTVRIPVAVLGAPDQPDIKDLNASSLLISKGAADELPEGPTGFDVLDDGGFVIADPLRKRLAVFDAHGKLRKAWKVGFPPDSVSLMKNGLLAVQESGTDALHVFDTDGTAKLQESAALPQLGLAHVLSGTNAVVIGGDHNSRQLEINYERPGSRLVSLQVLGYDFGGSAFVALESTLPGDSGDEIRVNKSVRKYSNSGRLLGEVSDILLAYYIAPIDELRVHGGKVYQLMPTANEVRINIWDMNGPCSQNQD